MEPGIRGRGAQLILIESAICLPNRFEHKPERCGNIEIVIERFFKLIAWSDVGVVVGDLVGGGFSEAFQPSVDPAQRLP